MESAELWLEDIPPAGAIPITCPRCGCQQFTANRASYGVELACWRCPTYIGVRTGRALVREVLARPM